MALSVSINGELLQNVIVKDAEDLNVEPKLEVKRWLLCSRGLTYTVMLRQSD